MEVSVVGMALLTSLVVYGGSNPGRSYETSSSSTYSSGGSYGNRGGYSGADATGRYHP